MAAGTSGLQIVDVTQTSAVGGITTSLTGARRVKYLSNYAYVVNDGSADASQQGFYIVDVSNPAAPRTLSFVPTASGATGVDLVSTTVGSVVTTIAYVTEGTSLQVFDVSNPLVAPGTVGQLR